MYNKTTYLIDTENVGTLWNRLLSLKSAKDRILVFYTDKSPNISYKDMLDIIKHPESFETIKCNQGKNGLDFQLVSYLGFLLKSTPKTDYVIISKDAGYDVVCKFWTELGYSVSRTTNVSVSPQPEATAKDDTEEPKGRTYSRRNTFKSENDSVADETVANVELSSEIQAEPAAPIEFSNEAPAVTPCETPENAEGTVSKKKPTSKKNTVKNEKAEPVTAKKTKKTGKKTAKDPDLELITGLIPEQYSQDSNIAPVIYELLKSSDMTQLQKLHRIFVGKFGQAQGTELYKSVKPKLKSLNIYPK